VHHQAGNGKKNIQRILDLHQDFDPSSYCPRMHGNKYIIKLEMEKNYYKNSRPALRLSCSIKLLSKDAWKQAGALGRRSDGCLHH
jgi:hypothetical protein